MELVEPANIQVFILAGGLGTRMGQDKASLLDGESSFVQVLSERFKNAGYPVEVIVEDLVPRCGPIGGIYTGLKQSSRSWVLFLACDMPAVSIEWTGLLIQHIKPSFDAIWTIQGGTVGFPCLLQKHMEKPVFSFIQESEKLSIQRLARTMSSYFVVPGKTQAQSLANINTPEQYRQYLESKKQS
jgi:molybdopterin-guanine dinucleotide biosynthesis protein A